MHLYLFSSLSLFPSATLSFSPLAMLLVISVTRSLPIPSFYESSREKKRNARADHILHRRPASSRTRRDAKVSGSRYAVCVCAVYPRRLFSMTGTTPRKERSAFRFAQKRCAMPDLTLSEIYISTIREEERIRRARRRKLFTPQKKNGRGKIHLWGQK